MSKHHCCLSTGALPVLLLIATTANAANSPRGGSADPNRVRDRIPILEASNRSSQAAPRLSFKRVATGSAPAILPGTVVGTTFFEVQHHGSCGRQVDMTGVKIQAAWTYFPTSVWNNTDRAVYWNAVPVAGSPQNITLDNSETLSVLPLGPLSTCCGADIGFVPNSGYLTLRNKPGGRAVVAYMSVADPDLDVFAAVDASAGAGVFTSNLAPQPGGLPAGGMAAYPQQATDIVGTDTILHLVGTERQVNSLIGEGDSFEIDKGLYYWRGDINGHLITWSAPVLLDTVSTISAVVEASTVNDQVAIVYTRPRAQGTQIDNDVVYRLSTNGGVSWESVVNITSYSNNSPYRAYTDLTAAYDQDNTLHIVYNTLHFEPGSGTFFEPCNLFHWSSASSTHSVIATADWVNTCSATSPYRGDVWDLQLAKPSLTVKPAGAGPGAGIPDELLYAIWVQFGPTSTDCATQDAAGTPGGHVNGEIWWSVSSNDGLTWDRPTNVTGTVTADCLPGNCHSEHWVTSAARADSGVYVSYVDDAHAGRSEFGSSYGEGEVTDNSYMVNALTARTPVSESRIHVSQTQFSELNVSSGGMESVAVTLSNLGNALLNYTIDVTSDDGGSSHVLVNGGASYNGSIAAGAVPEVVTVSFDGVSLPSPSEKNWRLEVTSNDPANDPGSGGAVIDLELNVFVADVWYTCESDTISTSQHGLSVSSCLGIAFAPVLGQGPTAYDESVIAASPLIARIAGPDKVVYRDLYWHSVAQRSRDSNQAFRPQSALAVSRSDSQDVVTGTSYTTDSVLQIDYEVIAYKEPELSGGVLMRYAVSNRSGSTLTGVYLGAVADPDVLGVPSVNFAVADSALQYVGAQGAGSNHAALFFIAGHDGCSGRAIGGRLLDNAVYVYPYGAFHTDSLYDLVARTSGWSSSVEPVDTFSDLSALIVTDSAITMGPNDTVRFTVGVAVTHVSLADLDNTAQAFQVKSETGCADSDGDGVSDVLDNCPDTPNPLQEDSNLDDVGDSCTAADSLRFIALSDTSQAFAEVPILLVVTDPLSDSLGPLFNTILKGSAYITGDVNGDATTDDIVRIPSPVAGDYGVRVVRKSGFPDSARFTLAMRIDGNQQLVPEGYADVAVSAIGTTVPAVVNWTASTTLPGDVNRDGVYTSADIIFLVNYIFKSGPPPAVPGHADVNCDGNDTSSDIIRMVNFIFKSSTPPCSQSGG